MNICAIFKNEALYLKEWIEFHRIVGVDRFYLYDNNSTDDFMPILQPYIDSGVVDLTDWPMPNPSQAGAYMDYIRKHRGPWWTAFIDCDEFLFSPTYDSLPDILKLMPSTSVGVNWMVFGSGNQQDYLPHPVIERFTWRPHHNHPVDLHIKSVIWMDQVVSPGSDPHFFHVQGGTVNEKWEPIGGPHASHTSQFLRINHYSSKSYNEWQKRIRLGKPDRGGIEINEQAWYWDRQQMEVDDRVIQHYLPELKERLK